MNKAFTLKIYFVAIIFSLLTTPIFAQVFQKNFAVQGLMPGAHHFTESVIQTGDGNFVFQGWNLADLMFPKMTLLKINQYSNIVWQRAYTRCAQILMGTCILEDFTASSIGGCVQQTNEGGFIMTGSLNDKMVLIKTTSDGNTVTWAKTYGSSGTYGKFVKQTSDLGYICVGYSHDFEGTKTFSNVFIVKTSSNGTLQWDGVYRFSPNYDDGATEVDQLANGDFVVTGYSTEIYPSTDTTSDILLMRLNSSGTLLWAETYGDSDKSEEGQSIRKTTDGGYIVSGHTEIQTGVEPFLWKLNSADVYDFQNVYKIGSLFSIGITFGYSAQQTSDGGYALFGITTNYSLTSITAFSNYMLKLDQNADTVFCKTYKDSVGGSSINLSFGYSIWNDGKQLANGGYLIGGSGIPVSGNGFLGYKLIKTNTLGESGCSESKVSPIKAVFTPASHPKTLTNLSTGSAVANIDIMVKNPTVVEEHLCYEQCTALPGNDTIMCNGGSIQLGHGGPNGETAMNGIPTYSYSWSSIPAGFTSNIEDPIVSPAVNTTYILTITDSDFPTPCSDIDTIIITISPQPTIHGITATPQTICEGTSSQLIANTDNTTSFAWSPATSPSNNDTVTASPSATTTYTVTATNACGSVSADVVVTVVPAPVVNIQPNDTICEIDTLYTIPGTITNFATIAWTSSGNGTFSNTTISNPTYEISPSDISNGTVTLTAYVTPNSTTCSDTTLNIIVAIMPTPPPPTFIINPTDTLLCQNDASVTLSGTPLPGVFSGPGVTGNTFNPSNANVGLNIITYTFTNSYGCSNHTSDTIKVIPLPVVTLGNFDNICIKDSIKVLKGGLPAGGTYSGAGVFNDSIFKPVIATEGLHTIIYTYTDPISNCTNKDSATIYVVPNVILEKDPSDIYTELGQDITFTATAISSSIYSGIYDFAVNSNSVQAGSSNTYLTSTLISGDTVYVTLDSACYAFLPILLKDLPNAFIPTSSEAKNQIFMPNVDLTIVNRWGQEIYKGTDGWDGKYKGQYASPGTYFYIINIANKDSDEVRPFTGTVTLIAK